VDVRRRVPRASKCEPCSLERLIQKLEIDKEILADQNADEVSDFAKTFPDTTK
jgi:hypothetical protein